MREKADRYPVEVTIHSECRSSDETLPMDVYTTGSLYQKNDHLYLVYEAEEDDGGMSKTMLKVESGKRVTMTKKGWHELHFVLEEGKHNVGYYSIPEGTLSLGVMTTRLEDRLTPQGGTLEFTYNTDSGGYEMFENNITIQINPTTEE